VSAVGEYGGGRFAVALGACCRDVEFDVGVEEVPARVECCCFGREHVSRDGGVGCECFAGVWTDEAPATVDQREQCSTEDGNEDARADQEFNVKRCIRHLWMNAIAEILVFGHSRCAAMSLTSSPLPNFPTSENCVYRESFGI